MRKFYLPFLLLLFIGLPSFAQPWTYDFGSSTGTADNSNSGSGNTSFFTSTPSGGGTYRVRIGNGGGSCILANPGTTLGALSEAQLNAATSTSTNKWGVHSWNTPTTVAYLKAKIRTTSSGNGALNISLGVSTLVSDNQGFTSHYNNALTSLRINYASGAISSVTRRTSGADNTISTSGLLKDTDQTIEIYANNGATSTTYDLGGTTYTLNAQQWDLWVAGVKISPAGGWAKAGTLAAGTALSGFAFFAESSTGNAAGLYIDDIEYSDILPTTSCSSPSTQASVLASNTPTTDGFSTSWTAGNGNGTMIVVRPTSSSNTVPSSGSSYTANLAWGSAGQIDVNNRVVFRTAGTSCGPTTGLSAETQYTVTAYEYNTTGDCYNLTSPPSTTIYTLSTEPTAHSATFNNSVIAYNQIDLTYSTPGSGADGYVILRRSDGTNPTTAGIVDGVAPGSWSLPSGTVVANANATGTSWSNTGLSGSTNYCYLLVPFNWNGSNAGTYNYRTTATVPTTCGTTPAPPSLTSDIVLSGMIYTSNIDYLSYQVAGPFTNTSGNVGVMGITIRDGGASSPDGDALPTIVTGITFSGITGTSMIRAAGLFEGNALVSGSGIVNTGSNTISFTGLSYSCGDNSTRDLTLRVSFQTTVTDNLQMVFNVTNANVTTASGSTSSQMSAFTTVTSSTTGDRNRIEVTATKLLFVQQPTNTAVSVGMTPAVTVRATDVNNNTDLDFVGSVSVTSTGTLTGSPVSATASAGLATFSGLTHTVAQTARTLTATYSGLTSIVSNTFDITTVTYATGDYRTNPLFTGSIFFNSTNYVSGIAPWQSWNGSTWVDVTHSTGSPNSPENLATKPGTIYVGGGAGVTYVSAAGGANYNNIIVEFALSSSIFYSADATIGIGILTGKKIEIKKGVFDLRGRFDLQGTGQLIIRDGAEMDIASSSSAFLRNASSTWEVENNAFVFINSYIPNAWTGTEIFHEESYFEINDWSDANPLFTGTGTSIISTTPVSGYSAAFGYLTISIPNGGLTGNWTGILPAGISINLTHGDFEIDNADASNNLSLYSGNTSTVRVGNHMIVNGVGNVQMQTGAGSLTFTVDGNFTKNGSGDFRLHTYGSASSGNDVVLNIDGNLTVNTGFFMQVNTSSGGPTTKINLKGNLKLTSGAYLTNSDASGYANDEFNFTGGGTIQTVDVVPHASNDLMRIRFFVKTNAYVQFINQDVAIGTNSGFTVEADATLDFGFNGTTALNLVTAGSNTGTYFSSLQKSILKITNTGGISTTSGAVGNVQVVASNRSYHQTATFWYIGKADQFTGNGITSGSTPKVIICDLISQTTKLSFTNSTAISGTTTVDAVYGGHLYIKKGRVEESTSAYITSGGGTLRMEPGTYYYIPKGNNSLALADADPIPRLSSAIHPTGQYYLNGGTIELAGTGANGYQSLRGNNLDYKIYKNITYSGANVSGTDYKNLTSNVVIDSALTIIGDAIVECHGLTTTTPQTFTGAGGLVMSGTNSRIRFLKLNTAQPELTGVNVDYALTGGYVEFYGSGATQQQQIRGTYDSPTKVINYYNIDVNANAANYSSGIGAGGNLDLISSITLQGTMNVNSPAVLRLDETDFIYKYVGNSTNTVNINSGAGLLYGSPFGITTVATGGTGLDPTVGAANPSAGNIRTSIRSFNSGASYGFVGNENMPSGDGIPSSVAGLYVYKTASADVVTLSKSVLDNGVLALHNGKILSSSTNKLTLETTASIVNTPTNAGGVANMGHENSYVIGVMGRNTNASGSEKVFPIGSASVYGPLAITPASATAQTYSCEYFSTGFGDYDIDAADVPMLDHVSAVEYWTVASTASGANDNANVKLYWRVHTIVSSTSGDWADLRVAHHDGADWNDEGNNATSGVSTSWGYVQSNVVPNFSPITFGSLIPDNPLPVELITFVANCDNGAVNVHWATASEVNNDYFVLEKSEDGENFAQLAVKDGYNTTNITHHYFETDNNPYDGTTYYRLKQVDNNGEVSYSKIIKAECFNGNDEFVNVFYAPGAGITATSYMNEDEDFNFRIYNDIGQVLFDFNKNLAEGFTRNLLNNADLATGTYFVTAESNERRIAVKLFVP